jgi:hypothetical protein
VYYKDVADLRDIFGVTRVGGAVGGSKMLLRVDHELRKDRRRPTSEFDYPVKQRNNRFRAGVDVSLGWRQTLMFGYQKTRYRIDEERFVDDVSLQSLLDRDEDNYILQFARHLTAKTDLLFDGLYQIIDYTDDASERDANAYAGRVGFAFSPQGDLDGAVLLGYKRIIPLVESQADYSGPIGSVDVRTGLGRRMRTMALYVRDAQPSVQNNNWFFIENRYGAYLDVFLAAKFYIRPGAVFGTNNYPRPARFTNREGDVVEEPIHDRFQIYSLSFNFNLTDTLILRVGGSYMIRDSNVAIFDKDRLLFNFGITTDLWPRDGWRQSWF